MRMHRHETQEPFLPGTEPGSAKERFARAFQEGQEEARQKREAHEQNGEPVRLRPEPYEGLREDILREGKYYTIEWQTQPGVVSGESKLRPIYADDQSSADALNKQLEDRAERQRVAARAKQPILRGVKRFMGKSSANGSKKGGRHANRH